MLYKQLNHASQAYNTSSKNYPKVYFTREAYDKIRATVGSRPAESGCLLLGYEEELNNDRVIVRDIIFDKEGSATEVTYSINATYLNPLIKQAFQERNLAVIGIEHSHPYGYNHPSSQDMTYFSSMIAKMPRKYLVTPIAFTDPDGGFNQFVYIIDRPNSIAIPVESCILDEDTAKNEPTIATSVEQLSTTRWYLSIIKQFYSSPYAPPFPKYGFAGAMNRY